MSTNLTEFVLDSRDNTALSGAGLLGIVTTGMYDTPLSIYREYIQNSADAVAGSRLPGTARVVVSIDVSERRIRIRDNGPGLSCEEALEQLLPIGRSNKSLGIDRGFRGVGRLAGLAFAKTVSFTTRALEDQSVTRVTWHGDRLPALNATDSDLEAAILECVSVETLLHSGHPQHFFEVEIRDVARHSAGVLLNRDAVRDYVGEVCPVPISSEFPFVDRVDGLFYSGEKPLTLEVLFEGEPDPVERPYGKSIRLSANREAEFTEFQVVRIPRVDGNRDAVLGWIAHSYYLGAIPKEQRVRGVRARMGNVQIGGETVFDNLFAEVRFNRWCVGELHILDSRIIPNARRDYFEPGPHLRNVENHLIPVLRNVSTRCRRESTARNRDRRALSALCNIEDQYLLATSGYLTSDHSVCLVQDALQKLAVVRKSLGRSRLNSVPRKKIDDVEEKLRSFPVGTKNQRFGDLPLSEIVVYQRVFGALATLSASPGRAREVIEQVLVETARVRQNDSSVDPDQTTESDSHAWLALDDTRAPTDTEVSTTFGSTTG